MAVILYMSLQLECNILVTWKGHLFPLYFVSKEDKYRLVMSQAFNWQSLLS